MNDEFVQHALAKGDIGKQWLADLPNIIKKYEEIWSFKALPPFQLSYNYVTPVINTNQTQAVLRIGIPWEKDEFRNETDALKVFHGKGVPQLLKEDMDNGVILMELVTPGTPLSTLKNDDEATQILAQLMRKIWKPVPKNFSFPTIFEWSKAIRTYPTKGDSLISPEIISLGIHLFDELIATTTTTVLTHADIHHDNVLLSNQHGWMAIDPKGIIADPLYDTSAIIRNPYKKIHSMHGNDLDKLLQQRIEILAEELQANAKRIHMWCLAQTILSGVWTEDNKEYTDHALKVISSLRNIQKHF